MPADFAIHQTGRRCECCGCMTWYTREGVCEPCIQEGETWAAAIPYFTITSGVGIFRLYANGYWAEVSSV